ncbi:hypothetical protein HWV62_41420 [Athelia sp. TMB]|nr:hypothetical protein HWV62_41420 [Athelia sp. TMB]
MVDSSWEAVSAPSAIGMIVSIDNRLGDAYLRRIGVAVRLDQTLGTFKQHLLDKHAFDCTEHTLILIGRELKDDDSEQTLGDLGLKEGCTIHAVAAIQFSVATQADEDYEFALKPTTRISEIRKLLGEIDADVGNEDFAFSLDGVHTIRESRTLWDMNVYSGTTFILKNRQIITLILQWHDYTPNARIGDALPSQITIDIGETLDDLQAQIRHTIQCSRIIDMELQHRRKKLEGPRTIRMEGLEGGDVIDVSMRILYGSEGGPSCEGLGIYGSADQRLVHAVELGKRNGTVLHDPIYDYQRALEESKAAYYPGSKQVQEPTDMTRELATESASGPYVRAPVRVKGFDPARDASISKDSALVTQSNNNAAQDPSIPSGPSEYHGRDPARSLPGAEVDVDEDFEDDGLYDDAKRPATLDENEL